VQAHVLKAFQRFAYGVSVTPPTNLDAAESLVFWLGGVPIGGGTARGVEGFSANVANPFQGSCAGAIQRTQPFFSFDARRLTDLDGDGFWEFVPHGRTTPYVYFRSDTYAVTAGNGGYVVPAGATGAGSIAVPYMAAIGGNVNMPNTWVSPNAIQIIAAGADDFFGSTAQREFPSGAGYDQTDNDNLTNFSRTRLEGQEP
jgi:hypothetical protein